MPGTSQVFQGRELPLSRLRVHQQLQFASVHLVDLAAIYQLYIYLDKHIELNQQIKNNYKLFL